jgi:hypothetical protein
MRSIKNNDNNINLLENNINIKTITKALTDITVIQNGQLIEF